MDLNLIKKRVLEGLTGAQKSAVRSKKRRLLVVAGAGSGKTEVMARRVAWWIGIEKVPKNKIIAFTFTERAAEEMKFRIRSWIAKITASEEDISLGNMYVGTIHGFCLAKIREFWPDYYHNYDILDEAGRAALILRGFNNLLGLRKLREVSGLGQYATIGTFTQAYDQLHEHNRFEVELPSDDPPLRLGGEESKWCKKSRLLTDVGDTSEAIAFAKAASRYYAYLRCRRFLDFSTSQTEFIRRLNSDAERLLEVSTTGIHLVVDEIQDINPVQRSLMEVLVGVSGKLTAVGDHRQSIYGFRGAKVEIIAELWEKLKKSEDAEVVDLLENFRSTARLIDLANCWAETISPLCSMKTPPMKHGNPKRKDQHSSHIALIEFDSRLQEAGWIADAIRVLVPSEYEGARHDKKDGAHRGLTLSDIAVLIRSSTDSRTYMEALEAAGIPAVVKAGPDLFSQPEVLFFISALAITAGNDEFIGSAYNPKSLPNRIEAVLGCDPKTKTVLKEASKMLRRSGLTFDRTTEDRVLFAAHAIGQKISEGKSFNYKNIAGLRTPGLREFLTSKRISRRVFPQKIYHFLLSEACVERWDTCEGRGQTAMFHLGALSGLVTGIETPGWTSVTDYRWQIIGLCQHGAEEGRAEEQPLMVKPEAVTISTIHGVKGLEFAAIFLADVNARRFPSGYARRKPKLPLAGEIVKEIDIKGLADNENYDGERRLMYVALTRAERFLLISRSGKSVSRFVKELRPMVEASGGTVTRDSDRILNDLRYAPKEYLRDVQLCTSFSDLRYYMECPHDFYLRKVLGFAPTIDQAFGYGRGIHNLLRSVHTNPKKWAVLASDPNKLKKEIQRLINLGLFYLRYTTGEPAENMRQKGLQVVTEYIIRYADELSSLKFEPEKEFETLIEYEEGDGGALISGAIDIIRQDDPPRVTLIDFKSGDPDSDRHKLLDEEQMKLQIAIYALAAKKELEYQPEQGLVRYLGAEGEDSKELKVPLDSAEIEKAGGKVSRITANIRDRVFNKGPSKRKERKARCKSCDFIGLCGVQEAVELKDSGITIS
ncbi:MAG: ATP-dependent helicase [Desulfobacterales bacterium]|uniref:DNA 3'-5' helicase n=1 Tax=Candidatus Desulfatibia vada TaxID=2841696 RepID=A0A8J6NS53_9BACT|nr:ATP-dependent helicase [Candidatus Desulfatibia vada]